MPDPRELHNHLVSPVIAAPIQLVAVPLDNGSTTTVTIVAFKATRKCRLVAASYHQESDCAGTSFTAQVKVGATALTDALDIAALGADAGADWTPVTTVEIADGDVVDVVFTASSGTTAPDLCSLLFELQLLE